MRFKFLFENLGIRQTIFKNTFWLALAEVFGRFSRLVLIIFVARILGATEYGKFTFAVAFVSLFTIFSDLGLSQIITREFSQDLNKENDFSALFSFKLISSCLALFLMFFGSFFITPDLAIRQVIWILSFYILIVNFPEIFYAFFRARQKMEYEALFKILQTLLIIGFGFFIVFKFPSIENLSYSYLFSSAAALIFIFLFFYFKILNLRIRFESKIWKKYLLMSWPLGLSAIFSTIVANFDSTMMGHLGQIKQTGWFDASTKIIDATLIPAVLISQSFFPVLNIAFKNSKERLEKIWTYYLETIAFLAIPIAIGGLVLSPKIVLYLFRNFFPSILVFQILIIGAGISYFSFPLSQILIVSNQQKKIFLISFLTTMMNIILNLILIPRFSLYGAAISSLTSTFLSFILFLKFSNIKFFNKKFLLNFLGVIISSIIMYFVISQPKVYHRNLFLSIFIGAGVYLICYFFYRILVNKVFGKS